MDERDRDRLGRYLASLPAATPPPRLQSRIARGVRLRRRRSMLAAAAAVAAAVLLPQTLPRQSLPDPGVHAVASAPLAEIRQLDRDLQRMYAPGSERTAVSPVAVDSLWQARADALRRLEQPDGRPPHVVRL